MTGRDLILHIVSNRLEDEEVFKDGKMLGFKTMREYAVKTGFGMATIQALVDMRAIPYILIGDTIFIPNSFKEKIDDEI